VLGKKRGSFTTYEGLRRRYGSPRCLAKPWSRQLTSQDETAFPALAVSLRNLGIILSELGRHEEALAAGALAEQDRLDEALAVTDEGIRYDLQLLERSPRRLAADRPKAFQDSLATSLYSLGVLLRKYLKTATVARVEPAPELLRFGATSSDGRAPTGTLPADVRRPYTPAR
jgi:hypothetical protein